MDKKQIAAILKEMAVLMEIRGDNPFKVRAHENAARILEGLNADIKDVVESGEITKIKGIGKGTADKITTLLNEGKLNEYDELKAAIPAGLLEMSKISGMGAKKIKAVWDELGITSIGELEKAAKADKLSGMKGFGGKTQEKILQNIELLKKFQDRHRLPTALEAGQLLLDALKDLPGIIRCEVAGSLRRWKETIKDVDLVVSAADADRAAIMGHFTTLPAVQTINAKGDTKSSVVLENGISADLRIVADEQFPYILHHSTGSKEHNVAMRQHAIKRGMKISEWGVFKDEENIPCKDEAEIFRNLGMVYITPELRENYGEIDAALENRLPELIEMSDIKGMIHAHSTWSDGVHSIEEMARACQESGYEYLAISDHSKAAAYANGLSEERIKQQHAEVDDLNAKLKGFRVLKGIECDILRGGELDYTDEVLATFDLVIASIHSSFNMTEAEGTQRIINAMENPYVTILGHPTGRLLLKRDGYPINHHAVIDAAAELGVCIEINANPRRLDLDWRYCQYAKEKGVKIAINPDAHRIAGLEDMKYGLGIARKGWLTKADILNTYSVEDVLAFAQKRNKGS